MLTQNLKKENSKDIYGIVFNIQRFSIHDGPGIRTVVFLKGCPLNCLWCSNPESQETFPRILHDNRKCIGCGACTAICPNRAIKTENNGFKYIDPDKCTLCKKCIEVCYAGALELIGKRMTVDEVMLKVRQDRAFYNESGGGVTLSGGEPTIQYNFAEGILDKCINEGIDTALETCGFADWDILKKLIEKVDLVLYDIKHMNSKLHKSQTGQGNELILENARKISKLNKKMIIRVPVIPTYNDSEENIRDLMNFVHDLKTVNEVHLLPYHRYGRNKYTRLGWEYPLGDLPSPEQKKMEKLKAIGEKFGIITQIGG